MGREVNDRCAVGDGGVRVRVLDDICGVEVVRRLKFAQKLRGVWGWVDSGRI